MALAIFDLDNTLIGGDSDNLWGQFVVDQGLVDGADFERQNNQFYEDYQAGDLDILAYVRFALGPLKGRPMDELARWHATFMREVIDPLMLPKAAALIDRHRQAGDHLLVITATNVFVTRPIVDALGIEDLLACDAEIVDGRYTGEPAGIPTYREGKVQRLQQWLAGRSISLEGACFYSDSHNDLPLLELIDKPIAVDPDTKLRAVAEQRQWPIISLRD
ncbi:MAG: HAD family hydrolase [Pseudomonadota bacterium]